MKKRSKNSNVPKELQFCIKVAETICTEYPQISVHVRGDREEISAFVEAAARLGQIARDGKHLAKLLYAYDCEAAEEGIPLRKWGTDRLKRVLRRLSPDVE
jgi:hypothetical protein